MILQSSRDLQPRIRNFGTVLVLKREDSKICKIT